MDTIDIDLPCARCGYNLRTLPRSGTCPECGESVDASIAADVWRRAGIRNLVTLGMPRLYAARTSTRLMLIAWTLAATTAVMTADVLHTRVERAVGALILTPLTASFVVGCWAAFCLSRATPPSIATIGLRLLTLAGLLGCGLLPLNDSWRRAWPPESLKDWQPLVTATDVLSGIGALLSLAVPVSIGMSFTLLARLSGIAGRRWSKAFFAAAGCLNILIALIAIQVLLDRYASSREVMMARLSPVATWPFFGLALRETITSQQSRSDATAVVILLAVSVAQVGLPFLWFGLHRALTRAIRLGE